MKKKVRRLTSYRKDMAEIRLRIAEDNPSAAAKLWLHIDDQVSKLADPNFPRRRGRVAGTRELVAHKNYIVILIEDGDTVTAVNVVHARQQYP